MSQLQRIFSGLKHDKEMKQNPWGNVGRSGNTKREKAKDTIKKRLKKRKMQKESRKHK